MLVVALEDYLADDLVVIEKCVEFLEAAVHFELIDGDGAASQECLFFCAVTFICVISGPDLDNEQFLEALAQVVQFRGESRIRSRVILHLRLILCLSVLDAHELIDKLNRRQYMHVCLHYIYIKLVSCDHLRQHI